MIGSLPLLVCTQALTQPALTRCGVITHQARAMIRLRAGGRTAAPRRPPPAPETAARPMKPMLPVMAIDSPVTAARIASSKRQFQPARPVPAGEPAARPSPGWRSGLGRFAPGGDRTALPFAVPWPAVHVIPAVDWSRGLGHVRALTEVDATQGGIRPEGVPPGVAVLSA